MEARELHELHEHAEHGKHDPNLAPVSLTMAALAVLVAVASLLGHRAHTEEVLLQAKASDQWSYYQAKNIRMHEDEIAVDASGLTPSKDVEAAAKFREKYAREAERYRDERKEIEAEARKLEQEVDLQRRRANRFDLGEVFLEIALVIASITLLSGKRVFWHGGLLIALLGVAAAATGLFLM